MQEKAYFDNADVDLVGPPERHDLEFDPFAKERAKPAAPKETPGKAAPGLEKATEGKAEAIEEEDDETGAVEVIDLPEVGAPDGKINGAAKPKAAEPAPAPKGKAAKTNGKATKPAVKPAAKTAQPKAEETKPATTESP